MFIQYCTDGRPHPNYQLQHFPQVQLTLFYFWLRVKLLSFSHRRAHTNTSLCVSLRRYPGEGQIMSLHSEFYDNLNKQLPPP